MDTGGIRMDKCDSTDLSEPPFFADERVAITLSANPSLVKFNHIGYGTVEIPIFI